MHTLHKRKLIKQRLLTHTHKITVRYVTAQSTVYYMCQHLCTSLYLQLMHISGETTFE
jgi:hypothetical protein